MDFAALASTRRSIRKYAEEDVSAGEVVECVKTAVTAPSGCNSQCWKFVVVREKAVIAALVDAVAAAVVRKAEELGLGDDASYLEGKIRYVTFFKNAPVVVAVFMTRLDYYDKRMEEGYLRAGNTHESVMESLSSPDVLSIGAAIQNLLLALHENGLGACWMNEPVLAREEIAGILGSSPEERLMSIIPVGRPAQTPRSKVYKPLGDVVRVIE